VSGMIGTGCRCIIRAGMKRANDMPGRHKPLFVANQIKPALDIGRKGVQDGAGPRFGGRGGVGWGGVTWWWTSTCRHPRGICASLPPACRLCQVPVRVCWWWWWWGGGRALAGGSHVPLKPLAGHAPPTGCPQASDRMHEGVRAVVLGWIRARWGVSLGDWFGGPTLTNWIGYYYLNPAWSLGLWVLV
jgi:hypothetical protein